VKKVMDMNFLAVKVGDALLMISFIINIAETFNKFESTVQPKSRDKLILSY
jgi:hypothetical protein